MSDEYFTLVFKGSLRSFAGNPLKTKTPFGIPVAAGIGNAFDAMDKLEAQAAGKDDDDCYIEGLTQ